MLSYTDAIRPLFTLNSCTTGLYLHPPRACFASVHKITVKRCQRIKQHIKYDEKRLDGWDIAD